MEQIPFSRLPFSVKLAVGFSFFFVWNLFEIHVINKWLHHYLPLYRVGDPCVWDMVVALLIATALQRMNKNTQV